MDVAVIVQDLAGDDPLRCVDNQRLPIDIEHDDPPARSCHANHLRERFSRPLEVLEDPVGPASIERLVCEIEVIDAPYLEFHRQIRPGAAGTRLGDHLLTNIHADHPATAANQIGQRARIITGAAADVENPRTWPGVEQCEGSAFVVLGHRADAIEIAGVAPYALLFLLAHVLLSSMTAIPSISTNAAS